MSDRIILSNIHEELELMIDHLDRLSIADGTVLASVLQDAGGEIESLLDELDD